MVYEKIEKIMTMINEVGGIEHIIDEYIEEQSKKNAMEYFVEILCQDYSDESLTDLLDNLKKTTNDKTDNIEGMLYYLFYEMVRRGMVDIEMQLPAKMHLFDNEEYDEDTVPYYGTNELFDKDGELKGRLKTDYAEHEKLVFVIEQTKPAENPSLNNDYLVLRLKLNDKPRGGSNDKEKNQR